MATNLNLRQILMTDPIMNGANSLRAPNKGPLNRSLYAKEKGEQGFRLARLNRMKTANLNALLEAEPIVVRTKKQMGRRVNGTMKQLYSVRNGRHRLARSLANNRKTVKARINNTD
jgi:hypothetical protein